MTEPLRSADEIAALETELRLAERDRLSAQFRQVTGLESITPPAREAREGLIGKLRKLAAPFWRIASDDASRQATAGTSNASLHGVHGGAQQGLRARQRLGRKVREAGTAAAPDLDALALLPSEDAKAVMLHLMQPSGAGGRAIDER